MGRQTRRLGTQALLQPFAHGITDQSAGRAIDLVAVVGDSAHGAFRFVVISMKYAQPSHHAGNCFLLSADCAQFLEEWQRPGSMRLERKAPATRVAEALEVRIGRLRSIAAIYQPPA